MAVQAVSDDMVQQRTDPERVRVPASRLPKFRICFPVQTLRSFELRSLECTSSEIYELWMILYTAWKFSDDTIENGPLKEIQLPAS